MRRLALFALGALLTIIGLVWIVQGLGALSGSPMTGRTFWAIIGALNVLLGLLGMLVAARSTRRR